MGLARQIRRFRKRKEAAAAKKRRKAVLEPLEPRILLSADLSYTMDSPVRDLTLAVNEVDGVDMVQLINNEDPESDTQVVASRALSDTNTVEVIGSDLDDALKLELDLDPLLITFHGGSGGDTLFGPPGDSTWNIAGDDSGTVASVDFFDVEHLVGGEDNDTIVGPDADTSWIIEGTDAGQVAGINFSGFENLTGGAGADSFAFTDGSGMSGVIDGGGGVNTLDYSAYQSGVEVDLGEGVASASADGRRRR